MTSPLPNISHLLTTSPGLPHPSPSPSYWQQPPHPLSTTQSPILPPQTDIAVIGSGITGLSVALTLLESHPSLTLTVLEARTLCSGATGRNGGQLATNVGEEYAHLKRAHGAERAGQICAFTLRNLDRMKALARAYAAGKESELQEVRKLRVFQTAEGFKKFRDGIGALERDQPGLRGVYTVLTSGELKENYNATGAGGALLPAGTIWPYRLVTRVFAALVDKYKGRFTIETNTPVTSVTDESAPGERVEYTVHTARGGIRAGKVVYCTNGYTGHLLPALRGKIYPFKGTMTVQDAGQAITNRGADLSWGFHYPSGYDEKSGKYAAGLYYLLQSAKTGYFFFGGEETRLEDCLSADDSKVEEGSVAQLREKLPRFLGVGHGEEKENWELVSAWTGVMGFSGDGLPLVGKLGASITGREGGGEFIAAAFNGYGMANCLLCGEALARIILGKGEDEVQLPEAYRIDEERMSKILTVENAVKYFKVDA